MSSAAHASASSPQSLPPARGYGSHLPDLAVDFDQSDRAELTTTIIALCAEGEPAALASRREAAWDLPVSARIVFLLRILELTTGEATLTVALTCPAPACRQRFEVRLAVAALAAEARTGEPGGNRIVSFPGGAAGPIAFRIPTGRDLAAWRQNACENETDALSLVVRSLATDPATTVDFSSEQLGTLAAAMEAADPLVAFAVETTCPHCRHEASIDVDLEETALRELAHIRRNILRDIHALATRYGWSEAEILAIPPRRRAEYRRLISEAEDSLP